MPTKDQLRSIEWAAEWRYDVDWTYACCPVCEGLKPHDDNDHSKRGPVGHGHTDDCWLGAALATPDTLPPVAVGDIVLIAPSASRDAFPRLVSEERHAVYMNSEDGRADIAAIYRTPLWQRGKD